MPRWATEVPREAWALFAALPLLQLTIAATGPVVPLVRDTFDLSYAAVGVFVASLSITRLILGLPAGQLGTRYNGRTLIELSAVVTLLACLLGALAAEYWQLLLARAILGGTSALNQAIIIAWLIGLAGSRNRGLVMGLHEGGFSFMVIFVPPLSGLLAAALSWRAPFVLGGCAAVVAGALVWLATRPEQADAALRGESAGVTGGHGRATAAAEPVGGGPAAPPGGSAGEASADQPSLRRLLVVGGPLLLAAYALTFTVFFGRNALLHAYLPLLGGVALELPPSAIGLAFGGQSLLSVAVTVGGGLLADRFGRVALILPGLGLLLLSQAALLLVRDVETFYLVVLFQAIGYALNALPPSLVGDALPRSYGSLGVAGYRLVADLAILAAPLVIGLALDYTGYTFPVVLLLAETALCTAVALVALRRGVPTRVLAQG